MTFRAGGLALVVCFAVALGCSSDIDIGQNLAAVPAAGGSIATGGTGGSDAGSASECQVTDCQGMNYECGNCEDDDQDGEIDSDDLHCTGPCDDNEGSFAIDIFQGSGPACKMDCYFDGDVGSGNDGCNWSQRCDPLAPSGDPMCSYDESAPIPGMMTSCETARVTQEPLCAGECGPLVPNGCDCFGCCELPAGSGRHVWLGSERDGVGSCTADLLDDPTACRLCTPVESCRNRCDPCELCVGRTTPDPSCTSGAPPPCPTGMAQCDVNGPSCRLGAYCITGCCVPEPR